MKIYGLDIAYNTDLRSTSLGALDKKVVQVIVAF